MKEDRILFGFVTFLLCHYQHLLLTSCQMWGDSRGHIDLSTGGGEDSPAVIIPQLLRVWCSAQYCQWRQCCPDVCSWSPAFPQVGIFFTVKLIFIYEDKKKKNIEGRILLVASFVLFQTFLVFWKHLQKHCSFGTSAHKLMQILDFFGHDTVLTRVTLCLIRTENSVIDVLSRWWLTITI